MPRTHVAVLGLGLAIAAIPLSARSVAGQYQITVSPSRGTTVVVQAGGVPLGVSLSGADASQLDSLSVRRGGAVAQNVTASLAGLGRLTITATRAGAIVANQDATPGSDYELLAWKGRGSAVVATFEVVPPAPALESLVVTPASAMSGSTAAGTVTLNRVAPSGGSRVLLAVSDLTAASVPSAVTVSAGQTSATFQVSTKLVEAARSVTVNATTGDQSRSAVLQVLPPPPPVPTALTLAATQVVGGFPATGTVTLDRAAPSAGTTVNLSVSDGAAASVPATVKVPAGQTSISFQVATQRTEQQRSVTVEASASGQSRSAALQLLPYVPVVSALTLSKTQATGGETVPASIRLASPPPAGGASIPLKLGAAPSVPTRSTLRTGAPTAISPIISAPRTIQQPSTSPVTIPPSVMVAAGQLEASFSVQTQPDSVDRQATISAGTAPNDASATLQVVSAQARRLVEVRVEGPDHVDEGSSASYRAIAVFDNGATADVTDYVFSWQVNSGVGATIQNGVLTTPVQVATPVQAVVQASWGMPDERLFVGSRQVTIRTWTVAVEGPDEVMESDLDSHLQTGAVHYSAVIVEPDGTRTPASGGYWSFSTSTWFSANLLPDGTFGVYAARRDEPTEIRARVTRNGVQKVGTRPVEIRYLPVKLESLRILDGPMYVDIGETVQLRAQAEFRGAPKNVVNANWALASSPPGTSIDPATGLLVAGSTSGSVQVTATYEQNAIVKTASWGLALVATAASSLQYIEILPPQPNSVWPSHLWEGDTRQYQAQASFMNGSKQIILPEWSVSGTAAQISDTGVLTTRDIDADELVTVTARYVWNGETKTATNDVLIRATYPVSCELETGPFTYVNIPWNGSYQFRLSVTLAGGGGTQLMTEGVTWSATATWLTTDPDNPAFAQPPVVSMSPAGLLSVPGSPNAPGTISGRITGSFTTGGRSCSKTGNYVVP